MSVIVIDPPAVMPVSLEEARQHLRIDGGDEDAYLSGLVEAAVGAIDGPSGCLGRAVCRQTLELRLSAWPFCPIELPYPPAASVEAVSYVDDAGALQDLPEGGWRIIPAGTGIARLDRPFGMSWPSARRDAESIRIRYLAGYENGKVPAPIRQAILLMVGELYAQRENASDRPRAEVPLAAERLLAPFRVWA
jgi:uncharacterized phiE125 gp8 family phage protein